MGGIELAVGLICMGFIRQWEVGNLQPLDRFAQRFAQVALLPSPR